jgi:hypothetical protein
MHARVVRTAQAARIQQLIEALGASPTDRALEARRRAGSIASGRVQ